MKILLFDETPAFFCPGGKQVHSQKLFENLRSLGVDVEYARWWDPTQLCDLIHLFSCSPLMVRLAHQRGAKVVLTHVMDGFTNLNWWKRRYRQSLFSLVRKYSPKRISQLFSWHILPSIDALVYMHQYDAKTAIELYGISRNKTHIIPHGCDSEVIAKLQTGPRNKQSYLISIANIVPRKNTILLAKAAKLAGVPVMFLGKAFNEEDNYYREFLKLVDNRYVIYPGYVSEEEKNRLLTEASGFVLLSEAESGCIAVYEGASAGLPMLLSDRPWSYGYGKHASLQYVDFKNSALVSARLKSFFVSSERLNTLTFPVTTWNDIAKKYVQVYQSI